MTIIDMLKARVRGKGLRIVFPEGGDARLRPVMDTLIRENLARPVLLFNGCEVLENAGKFPVGVTCLAVDNPALAQQWAADFREQNQRVSEARLLRGFPNPLHAGAIMLGAGGAEAMVAGLVAPTEEVIRTAFTYLGLNDGLKAPSSLFLMRIPGFAGSEGEAVIFADCGVQPAPDSAALAQIALTTAQTATDLLGWEPRVAFLSFSTDGSARHDKVDLVRDAVRLAQAEAPEMKIDGEFQLDTAIVPEVAARKLSRPSEVAGRANILIFPDLDAGNIAYKAVQRFALADAYGPFLQGFRHSVSDLSRGSTSEDILGVALMALARAEGQMRRASQPCGG
ncbi:phosphate acetyltransferase [Celeribacter ethanolicus]|uniref:Phosphate acetyltransferase n=1 Tax=Celeribacter ethanolicus TaxID=1758178 RepID=A0A291GH06_9RHOB|nr:phosphate acyltransferase [Celeribacter ethanolicus]ATG49306.1 phosphate acetyltransferase [Celeribacter ethanolicus]